MYGYNAEPPIAIPIYTVLPYCVIHVLLDKLFEQQGLGVVKIEIHVGYMQENSYVIQVCG